jgi:ComF family protein
VLLTFLKKCTHAASSFLLPQRCAVCRSRIEEGGGVCPTCWGQLTFLAGPSCIQCAHPFDVGDPAQELQCARCLVDPPFYDYTRSALLYEGAAKELILRFKHADAMHLAPTLAQWMAKAAGPLLEEGAILAPVPLHWTRLMKRKYNQAALLAREMARQHPHLIFWPELLKRKRATPPQGFKNKSERADNVHGAFTMNTALPRDLSNKVILLVDDVYTSGSTVNECARILKKAGIKAVYVLTIARVARL